MKLLLVGRWSVHAKVVLYERQALGKLLDVWRQSGQLQAAHACRSEKSEGSGLGASSESFRAATFGTFLWVLGNKRSFFVALQRLVERMFALLCPLHPSLGHVGVLPSWKSSSCLWRSEFLTTIFCFTHDSVESAFHVDSICRLGGSRDPLRQSCKWIVRLLKAQGLQLLLDCQTLLCDPKELPCHCDGVPRSDERSITAAVSDRSEPRLVSEEQV